MSMDSRCTIGAIASKNVSAFSSVSSRMASASGAEVRGPVATMTLSHAAGGSPLISPRRNSMSGWSCKALVTAAENPSRSTANAPPAGTWLASAARMISEPSRRISAWSNPTALLAASSDRNEFEHTSSARPSVRCASVMRSGRISCRTTLTPAFAACQAASEPARPPPIICRNCEDDWVPIIGTEVARFTAECTGPLDTTTPATWRALSVLNLAECGSAVIIAGCNARNIRAIKADVGQFAIGELGQLGDVALIVPERLDHADEREQHGVVSLYLDSALGGGPHRY